MSCCTQQSMIFNELLLSFLTLDMEGPFSKQNNNFITLPFRLFWLYVKCANPFLVESQVLPNKYVITHWDSMFPLTKPGSGGQVQCLNENFQMWTQMRFLEWKPVHCEYFMRYCCGWEMPGLNPHLHFELWSSTGLVALRSFYSHSFWMYGMYRCGNSDP